MDKRLELLKEAWSQMDEMPAWNDGDKGISKYLGKRHKDEVIAYNIQQRSGQVDNFDFQGYQVIVFASKDGKEMDLNVFFKDKEIGAFNWARYGGRFWKTISAAVTNEHQGKGIAYMAYTHIINKYLHTLMSDLSLTGETEGKGSFDLWAKLGESYHTYLYNMNTETLKSVRRFTRDMMGNAQERFVVSENELEDAITESLVSLPTDAIRKWLAKHIDELLQKIQETYTKGYNTYIDDPIDVDGRPVTVEIQKKLLSASPDIESALYFNEKEDSIYISAEALVSNLKKLDKIKSFVVKGIWHELTHVADPERLSQQDVSSYDAYVNSPREFPAFARMFIEAMRDAEPVLRDAVLVAIQQDKKIPVKEMDKWYKKLTPENKEKFKAYCVQELAAPTA